MGPWSRRTTNRALENIIGFEKRDCISQYAKLKIEIEKDIEVFNRRRPNDFYREWKKLYDKIIQKNNEIKHCFIKKYIQVEIIEDEDIKKFTVRCPNTYTCRNNPVYHVKAQAPLKAAVIKSCNVSGNCNKEIAHAKSPKEKPQSASPLQTSTKRSSPSPKPPKPSREHTDRKESKQTDEPSHTQHDVKNLGSSAEAQGKPSESLTIDKSDNPALPHASAQTATLPVSLATTEVNTHQNSHSSPIGSTEESDSSDSSEVNDLKGNALQSSLPTGQTNDNNNQHAESVKNITSGNKDLDNQTADVAIEGGFTPSLAAPLSGEPAGENAARRSSDGAGTSSFTTALAYTEKRNITSETTTYMTFNNMPTIPVAFVGLETSDRVNYGKDTDTAGVLSEANVGEQGSPVSKADRVTSLHDQHHHKTSCRESAAYSPNNSESRCNAAHSTESYADNLEEQGIFDQISNVILNNQGHMIKASIPIGIVLLLTLLFKVN
ncbi:hypothetical protein PVIIG_05416 [Plasmodium vivax India VII]|uniref:Variable surface protein Vir18 n=1 Tax=Plasmodium vivax India VII TaxID=1077284 RepID=A0A0J9S3L7_PLAVI|nr:hypothetical protein PVIIG_05416 [Plasmodium vivax India VII]